RHTRFSRDWSSDVCSSDLAPRAAVLAAAGGVPVRLSGVVATLGRATRGARGGVLDEPGLLGARRVLVAGLRSRVADTERQQRGQIGRASWRERGGDCGGAG